MDRKTVGFLALSFLIGVASTWNIGERELRSEKGLETVFAQKDTQSDRGFAYNVSGDPKAPPCIFADMNIIIELPGATKADSVTLITVPTNAAVSGTCGEIVSKMSLKWEDKPKTGATGNNTITFTFINDNVTFSIFSIKLDIQEKNVVKTSDLNLRLFPASVKNGMYKIDKYSWNIDNVNLTFENVRLIAFNTKDDVSSRKEETGADNSGKTFPYDLTADNQKHCILAKMSILLEVQYATVNGTMKKAIVDVPKNVTVSGDCDSQALTPQIVLYWPTGPNNEPIDKQNKITLGLQRSNPQLPLYAVVVDIVFDETNFPDALHAGKRYKELKSDFDTASEDQGEGKEVQIYSCPGARVTTLQNITLGISDILIVFDAEKGIESKTVNSCPSSTTLSAANFNYVLRNSKNVPCTLANMSVSMEVPYKSKDSKDGKATLKVPSDADVSGVCAEDLSEFTLAWKSEGADKQNRLTFYMKRDTDKFLAYRVRTDVYVDEKSFPNAADKGKRIVKQTSANLFATSLENGFFNCTVGNWQVQADDIKLTMKEVKLIMFNTLENIVFKKGDVCPDNTPTTPPTPTGNTTTSPNPPMKFDYVVEDKNSSVDCILANMTISVKLSYENQNSTKGEATLKVPANANVSGVCDKTEPFMKLSWTEQPKTTFDATDNENYVNLTFHKSDTEFFLRQVNVKLSLDAKNFPGAKNKTYEATSNALTIFPAALKNGIHKCVPGENVTVSDAVVSIKNVTVIAFNTQKNIATRAETNCVSDDSGSNAGAIVGGIIGGLILVGVIALGVIMYRRRRLY